MPGRIYKRGSVYWTEFWHKGIQYRTSCKTDKKREAEAVLAHYLGLCARGLFRGFAEQRATYTLFEMLDDFIAHYEQRGLRDVQITQWRSNNLRKFFHDIPVAEITERKVDLYIKHRLKEGKKRTTVNRDLQLLSQAFSLAKRKKLITDIPHMEKFSEHGNARQGFFEPEELEKIVAFLPDYLKDVARFAYHTGWRRNEIFTLEWRDVQGRMIYLRPEIAKNKDGRVLPLVGEIIHILERRQGERLEGCPYVFHRGGTQLANYYKAWRTACKKAGLQGKLLHDNRRTAARNMDEAGVPRAVAMALMGHKTESMHRRYRIAPTRDLWRGLERVEAYLHQNPAQYPHREPNEQR